VLAVFHGWAPKVVEAIERTPQDAIINVPGQDRPFRKQWGTGSISLLGDAAHPMLTSRSQADTESSRLCGAGPRAALRAAAIADPAHHPSHAIRPRVAGVMRTEVRRPLSPVERWFWIADQVSPLNVIARVRIHPDAAVSHRSAQSVPDGCLHTLLAALDTSRS
jgi:hypothetical protein